MIINQIKGHSHKYLIHQYDTILSSILFVWRYTITLVSEEKFKGTILICTIHTKLNESTRYFYHTDIVLLKYRTEKQFLNSRMLRGANKTWQECVRVRRVKYKPSDPLKGALYARWIWIQLSLKTRFVRQVNRNEFITKKKFFSEYFKWQYKFLSLFILIQQNLLLN